MQICCSFLQNIPARTGAKVCDRRLDYDLVYNQRNPTWWKRRTSMERCLTLTSAVTILIGVSLVIALTTVLYNRNRQISK
ncbi:unnamed protein product, partial [Callosobruchus maculatus]